jgi:hypothetical protein
MGVSSGAVIGFGCVGDHGGGHDAETTGPGTPNGAAGSGTVGFADRPSGSPAATGRTPVVQTWPSK